MSSKTILSVLITGAIALQLGVVAYASGPSGTVNYNGQTINVTNGTFTINGVSGTIDNQGNYSVGGNYGNIGSTSGVSSYQVAGQQAVALPGGAGRTSTSVAQPGFVNGTWNGTGAQLLTWLSNPNNQGAFSQVSQSMTPEQAAAFVQTRRDANISASTYNPNSTAANQVGNGVDVVYNQSKGCMTYVTTGVCVPITTGQGVVNSGYSNPNSQVVIQENNGNKYVCNANSGVTPQNVINAEKAGVCTLVVTAGTSGATTGVGGSSSGVGSAGSGQSGLIEVKSTTGGATSQTQTTQSQSTSQTQTTSQTLGDVDPNGTSSSCVELTSTTLRYRAKDADTNNEVTTLQEFLNENNYLTTAPTGFFGSGTLKAVKAFQKANNLNPTGYVGPNTRTAIKTISCA